MEIKMANISVLHLFKNTEKNMNLKKNGRSKNGNFRDENKIPEIKLHWMRSTDWIL